VAIKVNVLRRGEAPSKRASAGLGAVSMPKFSVPTGRLMPLAIVGALVVLVGMVGWGWWVAREKAREEAAIRRLQDDDRQLQLQLAELRLAQDAKREITRRLEVITRVSKSQKIPIDVMGGILKAVPQGIWLTGLDMKPQEVKVKVDANRPAISYSNETISKLAAKQAEVAASPSSTPAKPSGPAAPQKEVTEIRGYSVLVKGKAFNNFQVAEFMENLKKTGVFADVDFTVTQADAVEAVRVMDFEVTASVKL
jgi:Tfp pilus assembly protein PilN